MKIVNTDNFGGDYPNEIFIAENITHAEYAKVMCDAINKRFSSVSSSRYFKVVDDDYELAPGFEP